MKHQSHATLTALLFLSLLLVTESPRYLQDKSTSTLQQQIATQVLRFHIRANSEKLRPPAIYCKGTDGSGVLCRL